MRKIVSKKKNKQRFYQILFGLILVFIMFSSVLGYSFLSREPVQDKETITYNGITFINTGNFWVTNIESYDFAFRYNPKEVPRIDSDSNLSLVDGYYNKPLYIQSDEEIASAEIYNNLKYFVERMQKACLDKLSIAKLSKSGAILMNSSNESMECEGDLPLKDCSNNFIIIQANENNSSLVSIDQIDKCVLIKAPKSQLVKVTDEFLFKILGIEQ